MSETELVPPTITSAVHADDHKDNTAETITAPVADGAHTQPRGTEILGNTTEPVVIIAEPDTGTSNVDAQLLNPTTTKRNEDNNIQPTTEISDVHPPNVHHVAFITPEQQNTVNNEITFEQPNNANNTTTITTDEITLEQDSTNNNNAGITKANSASALNHNASSSNVHSSTRSHTVSHPHGHPHIDNIKGELRTSARNLRNSVLGIEEVEEVDEHGTKVVKKVKRKERSHSKIVLAHKKNLMGETIFKGHQSWVLMLNIQTGIRNAVGRGRSSTMRPSLSLSPSSGSAPQGQKSPEAPPTPKYPAESLGPETFASLAEFYASPGVLFFPSGGSSQTIPHQTGPFKFKDYSPHAFRFLRHRFGIDTADYMVSLCNTQKNGENALRELPTPGKSGSLFFFSHDMRFILKTIPKDEAKLLRALLPSYVEHIAGDENTLLPKFFGLHRVKPHRGRQVRFLVMSNVFQTRKVIHERYDLKGSTLGRAASEEEKKKDAVTYKDLDFRERQVKIQIGPQKRIALLEQLHRDCKFLAKLNIMDYSLLIGIHNHERDDGWSSEPPSPQLPLANSPLAPTSPKPATDGDIFKSIFQDSDGGMRGVDDSGIPNGRYYYMGIIDILMLYSARKKIEHAYKTLRYGKEEEISSISPNEYATRFYEFIAASIT